MQQNSMACFTPEKTGYHMDNQYRTEEIDMACYINVTGGELPREEIDAYISRAKEKYGKEPIGIDIKVDGDFVELSYDFGHTPFQRIRRITGYLVGTLDRFNNAKRAEERDRVKHSTGI